MIIPTWLILSAVFEFGAFTPGSLIMDYDTQTHYEIGNPLYTTLAMDAQAGPFFIAGAVETEFFWIGGGCPFDATYSISSGFRWRGFEIGWAHYCMHPVEWCLAENIPTYPRFIGSTDRFYLRAKMTLRGDR